MAAILKQKDKLEQGYGERIFLQVVEVTSHEDMSVSGCGCKGCQGLQSDRQHIGG